MDIHFQNNDFRSGHWPAGPPEILTILGLTVSLLFQSSIVCVAQIQPGIEIAGKRLQVVHMATVQ